MLAPTHLDKPFRTIVLSKPIIPPSAVMARQGIKRLAGPVIGLWPIPGAHENVLAVSRRVRTKN